jgi:hypothetical protein
MPLLYTFALSQVHLPVTEMQHMKIHCARPSDLGPFDQRIFGSPASLAIVAIPPPFFMDIFDPSYDPASS